MVSLYSGTPGSGKSFSATCKIIDKLLQGMNVISNFPIDMTYFDDLSDRKRKRLGKFVYLPNNLLNPTVLKNFAKKNHEVRKEKQSLIVIDECGIIFNPRTCMQKNTQALRMNWLSFFAQHRHLGYDILLISQSDKQIDKQMRFVIENEYRHRAIKNCTLFGFFLSKICGGLFIKIERWYDNKEKLSTEIFRYNKKKASAYDTFRLFD